MTLKKEGQSKPCSAVEVRVHSLGAKSAHVARRRWSDLFTRRFQSQSSKDNIWQLILLYGGHGANVHQRPRPESAFGGENMDVNKRQGGVTSGISGE